VLRKLLLYKGCEQFWNTSHILNENSNHEISFLKSSLCDARGIEEKENPSVNKQLVSDVLLK